MDKKQEWQDLKFKEHGERIVRLEKELRQIKVDNQINPMLKRIQEAETENPMKDDVE